jgi:DNA invertase Pin-like site-specific DNA recombinase
MAAKKANGQNIGYARVSSAGQNLDRQLEGVTLDKMFTEKTSAKNTDRPELKLCMDYLRAGDTLHVHSIDRLARNLVDLQNIVQELNDNKVTVHFHKENLQFAGSGDNATAKLMLQMLGAFAEFERTIIHERQAEGIAAAKKKGVKFGRKKTLSQEQIFEIKDRVAKGEQKKALSKEFGVSRQTIYTALG